MPDFLAGSLANVLRPITLVVTVVFFALLPGETLRGRRTLDEKAAYFHLAVLTAYAGIKELGRWRRAGPTGSRKGGLYVAARSVAYLAAVCAKWPYPERVIVPDQLFAIAVGTIAVYTGSMGSKVLFDTAITRLLWKTPLAQSVAAAQVERGAGQAAQAVLDLLFRTGPRTRSEVQRALSEPVASGRASRLAHSAFDLNARYAAVPGAPSPASPGAAQPAGPPSR